MREFTEAEKQWLIDHYPTMRQCDCAKYLCCSDGVIRRLAKQLGIYESRKNYGNKEERDEQDASIERHEEGEGYCLDCCHYRKVGHCAKTGKDTGALHKKICFKAK